MKTNRGAARRPQNIHWSTSFPSGTRVEVGTVKLGSKTLTVWRHVDCHGLSTWLTANPGQFASRSIAA